MRLLSGLLFLCVITLLGCGGGGGGKGDSPKSGLLSGNWQISLTQNPPLEKAKIESGFLLQSGSSLAGQVLLTDETLCPGLGTAQGKVDGSDVTITVNQVAQTITLKGKAMSDGSAMTGDYAIFASGCGGGSTVGTWTASQVKPLDGTFQATLSSYTQTGLTYTFAMTLAQAANTGLSQATLSGMMTSTDAPCAKNLAISGVISGTSVVLNFLAADGSAVGQYRGTTTNDATALTGTYDFLVGNDGCPADAGTVTTGTSAPV